MRFVVAFVGVAIAAPAAAQPTCATCTRGDSVIDHFALQALRPIAAELAAIELGDPVTAVQFGHLAELRHHHPVLVRVGALDDEDLKAVAAALCQADSGPCADTTTRTLTCLAERCTIDLPRDPHITDIADVSAQCQKSTSPHEGSPSYGLGFDWSTGWQKSEHPTDGRAWSIGIEGRLRLGRRLGVTARVDRVFGLDDNTDADNNGRDDVTTGPLTRLTMLVGPSFVLDNTRFEDTTRFLRLDLLGGYISTRSPGNENGPAAGFDLGYQLSAFRFGVRFVQGFGDARDASMLLAHLGLVVGAVPPQRTDDCGVRPEPRSSGLGLALDIPLGGTGISSHLGLITPGLGVEALWHVMPRLEIVAHADVLLYPGYHRDRLIQQAVFGGFRIDHPRRRRSEAHFFTTVMGGYTEGAGLHASSGAVADVSLAWGAMERDGGGYFRLHGRFGLGGDTHDYRAIFLSGGLELHLDPRRWRSR